MLKISTWLSTMAKAFLYSASPGSLPSMPGLGETEKLLPAIAAPSA